MLLYPMWYRAFGVRRLPNFTAPITYGIGKLALPQGAVINYFPEDTVNFGIGIDDPLVKRAEKIVYIEHITELKSEIGNPRQTPFVVGKPLRDYQRKTRSKFRPLLNPASAFGNPRIWVCENFAPLQFVKRYTTSFFANYYRWINIRVTMWKRINELAAEYPERHQFVRITLPDMLPAFTALRLAERRIDRTSLTKLRGNESFNILDMFQWLGDNRAESPLNHVETQNLEKINVIFQSQDKWFCVNLGLLNSWRTSVDADGKKTAGVDPLVLQKRFLKSLITLQESHTILEMEEEPEQTDDEEGLIPEDPENDKGQTTVEKRLDESGPEVTGVDEDYISDIDFKEEQERHLKEDLEEARKAGELDDEIDKDLESLDQVNDAVEETALETSVPSLVKVGGERKPLDQGIVDKANELAESGMMSASEYRRLMKLANSYKEIKNPYGPGMLADHLVITPESLKMTSKNTIPDNKLVFDKSMLQSSLLEFDKRYIEEIMPKDVVNSVMALQNAGIAVTAYEVEEVEDVLNHYEIHTIKLTPSTGASSTIRFKIPKVDPDGSYLANGVRYSLRKQRGDVPIRKVSPTRVALTSYYGKVFVDRSERAVNNYPGWLCNKIAAIGLDPKDNRVTDLKPSNVFDHLLPVPKLYSVLAHRFRRFKAMGIDFFLEYTHREKEFGEKAVRAAEEKGLVVIGKKGNELVLVDQFDTLYVQKARGLDPLGKLEELLELDTTNAPMEMAEIKIFNKAIPLGVALGYYFGLERVIKSLKPSVFRRQQAGERLKLSDGEYTVRFNDETLIFHRDDKVVALLMEGFNTYAKVIKHHSVYDFDRKDVYLSVLEANKIGVRYLRELDLLRDLFVDPITYDLLVEMKEPTEWEGLLVRATELLITDWAPSETDMEYMRIKGYERVAGAVYAEMVRSARMQNARRGSSGNKVEMAPHAIWQAIQEDPSKGLVEESNPIECLRTQEAVTFGGVGGRSRRSMVKRSRVFHPNDMGVISESTVDSGDVAISTFLTADPNFNSLRGLSRRYAPGEDGPTKLISTAALVSPCADRDDPKRVNFIGIQHHSSMFAEGYEVQAVQTGYGDVIPHRVNDLFAYTAKGDGVVVAVSDTAITVEYKDGTQRSVELGRRFGTVAGKTFPHQVVTGMKVGQKFKAGDVISYNSHYFKPSSLNPTQVSMKTGITVRTAIVECSDTLEDSSVISERVAKLMATSITEPRDLVLTFDQKIHGLVTKGQTVESEDILCTIEDAVTANTDLFDEDSIDTLRLLGSPTPKAKYNGVVERIEVFYNGDKEDMSPSLRAIADLGDKERAKVQKALNRKQLTGSVDGALRVAGNPLNMDSLLIRVYITTKVGTGVGDKGVFANQLKTIIGRVMAGVNRTESGLDLDALFSYTSISNRIVLSPELIGTTTTLLKVLSKRVVEAYRKG
ncbi:hypothetical protein D3C71_376660 [compost metagenome]